jgi:Dolichyl-phosphate-mannose-protein mannosyltransferase
MRRIPHAAIVFAVGLAVWIVDGLILLLSAPPLGHDEAQYVIAFQDAISDGPVRWFYLSKGMHAIAGPGVLAGGSEVALRITPWLCGIGFVLAAAHLAWRSFGAITAAWVVVVLATGKPLLRRSVDLLSDVPAAACLLVATSLLLTELTRGDGPRWRIWMSAPFFAAAFYVRYASIIPIAIVGLVALAAGWPSLRRRPMPAIAAAGLFLGLLLPHAVDSIKMFGSPLGVLLESSRVPQSAVSGLETYLTSNPFSFYGTLIAPLMIAGLFSLRLRSDRRTVALWIIAVAQIIAIGLTALGQARYVFFGTTLLVMLGVELVRRWIVARTPTVRRALVIAAAIAVAIAAQQAYSGITRLGDHRRRTTRSILDTAIAMRSDAAGRRCHFLANHYTQIEWYSGCNGHFFSTQEAFARGEPVYYVRDDSPGWQPSVEELALPHEVVLQREQDDLLVIRLVPAK